MERPAGVTAVALLSLLGGLLNLVSGYGIFSLSGFALGGYVLPLFHLYEPPPGGEAAAVSHLVLGFCVMLVGAAEMAFAWGAWNLTDWGWLLGLGLAAVGVAAALWGLISAAVVPAAPLAGLLVPALVGAYLLLPGTRRAFGLVTAADADQT
jgi:hypothetical protein